MSKIRANKRRRLHRTYLFQNAPVLLLMGLFLLVALSFFTNPNRVDSAIGVQHPYDYYWNAFYLIASILAIYGSVSSRVGVEAAGKVLFLPGLAMNFVVAVVVLGLHVTTILLGVFFVGFAFRALGLWMAASDD